ncbi:hypothetical protein FOA52_015307 [Chlamydomonas sp. UWO 241]|nr:hypothetical protein FOA52_015307 [Chlamydomonas sp. UWO 241]
MTADNEVTIAAAGAIPPLVQPLGAGFSTQLNENATAALMNLAFNADNKHMAAGALKSLSRSNAKNQTAIAAVGASAEVVQAMEKLGITN